MTHSFCLLLVAKAPVPGFAKTRLTPPATPEQAAEIAAASLLDTLDAVLAVPDAVPVVAMTGNLEEATRGAEIAAALRQATVIPQRGTDLGHRLAAAHADTAARYPELPVLQIGMDTPQVTAATLAEAANQLVRPDTDAVLGYAEDGGWWALGLREPREARILTDVPMSRPDTGELTMHALKAAGLATVELSVLSDVDTMEDALRVATVAGNGRFAEAVHVVDRGGAGS